MALQSQSTLQGETMTGVVRVSKEINNNNVLLHVAQTKRNGHKLVFLVLGKQLRRHFVTGNPEIAMK